MVQHRSPLQKFMSPLSPVCRATMRHSVSSLRLEEGSNNDGQVHELQSVAQVLLEHSRHLSCFTFQSQCKDVQGANQLAR